MFRAAYPPRNVGDQLSLEIDTPAVDDPPEPTPVEAPRTMNVSVLDIVESTDAPAAAERRVAALASAMSAVARPSVAASAPEAAGPRQATVRP